MRRNAALFVAIPVTKAALDAALARSDGTDFVAQLPGTDTWARYERVARLAMLVMQEARQAGVTVFPDASLEAWATALQEFPVVTLVAHWRSSEIDVHDILRMNLLLDAVLDHGSPLWATLRSFDRTVAEPSAYDVATLAKWLNAVLDTDASGLIARSQEARSVASEYRFYTRRPELERALPGVFRGGAAVEFAEGWRSTEEILRRIDHQIRGLVDLTICNSVLLGEEIRRKCSHCVVATNAMPATTAFRLALYRQAISLMKSSRRSYLETMMMLRQIVVDTARSKVAAEKH